MGDISGDLSADISNIGHFCCKRYGERFPHIVLVAGKKGDIGRYLGRLGRYLKQGYGLRYEPRTTIKGQVLADFIADFTPGATEQCDLLEEWILNVDGASNSIGAGIGIALTTPEGSITEQSFTLGFSTSNNEAEYEAILTGSEW